MTPRIRPLPALALLAALAACDSPSPLMMQGSRHEVRVEGTGFTVYRLDDRVEVYRTSPGMMPRRGVVWARAERAIAEATGCAMVAGSLAGDVALMTAEIDCG